MRWKLLIVIILLIVLVIVGWFAANLEARCAAVYERPCDPSMMECLFGENFTRRACLDAIERK